MEVCGCLHGVNGGVWLSAWRLWSWPSPPLHTSYPRACIRPLVPPWPLLAGASQQQEKQQQQQQLLSAIARFSPLILPSPSHIELAACSVAALLASSVTPSSPPPSLSSSVASLMDSLSSTAASLSLSSRATQVNARTPPQSLTSALFFTRAHLLM